MPPRRPSAPLSYTNGLRPLNQTGSGTLLDLSMPVSTVNDWAESIAHATKHANRDITTAEFQPELARRILPRHLIFKSPIAKFRLGDTRKRDEKLWKWRTDAKGTRLVEHSSQSIRETMMLDPRGEVVGRVMLPDPQLHRKSERTYDFVLLSEAQFFGDEAKIESGDYSLFNVMMVEWEDCGRPFARRAALGRVTKAAWWGCAGSWEMVVLG
jgi:hypothetical protein